MSALVENTESAGVIHPNRKRWTRAEVQRLIDEGHHEFERYELFDGELIDKMGKNWPHVAVLHAIARSLRKGFGDERILQESPINLRPDDDAAYRPEPGILVLAASAVSRLHEPRPADLVLAVEVSDISLRFDLDAKAKAYARAGIVEYWVADLSGRRVIIRRSPVDGRYTFVQAVNPGESVSPESLPSLSIPVDAIFA